MYVLWEYFDVLRESIFVQRESIYVLRSQPLGSGRFQKIFGPIRVSFRVRFFERALAQLVICAHRAKFGSLESWASCPGPGSSVSLSWPDGQRHLIIISEGELLRVSLSWPDGQRHLIRHRAPKARSGVTGRLNIFVFPS